MTDESFVMLVILWSVAMMLLGGIINDIFVKDTPKVTVNKTVTLNDENCIETNNEKFYLCEVKDD